MYDDKRLDKDKNELEILYNNSKKRKRQHNKERNITPLT